MLKDILSLRDINIKIEVKYPTLDLEQVSLEVAQWQAQEPSDSVPRIQLLCARAGYAAVYTSLHPR